MACDIELEVGAGATPGEYSVRVVRAVSGGEPVVVTRLDVDGLLRDPRHAGGDGGGHAAG